MRLLRFLAAVTTFGTSEVVRAVADDMTYEVKDIRAHNAEQARIEFQDNLARQLGHKAASEFMTRLETERKN